MIGLEEDAPRLIDLFAGCGGMTQGFVDAGFNPVMAVEWDRAAATTYAANFDQRREHTICADIAEVSEDAVPQADVVVGGPPCQGFSSLGRQDADDPRNKLWTEYVRILHASGADTFVIENVDRFRRSGEFERLMYEVDHGDLSDFEIQVAVLNAADFGVPQRRRRTIIVGSRVGTPSMPAPSHGREPGLFTEPWNSVRDAFRYVRRTTRSPDSLPDRATSSFDGECPGPFTMSELHFGRNPRQLSLDRYDVIPPGGGRHDLARSRPDLLPQCWRDKPSGTVDVMGRLNWDQPSVTVRTEFFKPEKGRYLHPEWVRIGHPDNVNRVITHREAALLQGFPNDFVWCGTKTQIARQIGNAVPPGLARAIADHIENSGLLQATQGQAA